MTNENIIESIISILMLDGEVNRWEMHFFKHVCQRLNVSQETQSAVLAKARQGKGRIYLPDSETDRNRLLYFLVQATVADGKVVPKEREILGRVVDELGISREYVDDIVDARLKEIKIERYTKPINATIICPKCRFEQTTGYQCKRCGIIFEKYKQTKGPSDEDILRDLLASSNKVVEKKS